MRVNKIVRRNENENIYKLKFLDSIHFVILEQNISTMNVGMIQYVVSKSVWVFAMTKFANFTKILRQIVNVRQKTFVTFP
jgi:hypothetical protein